MQIHLLIFSACLISLVFHEAGHAAVLLAAKVPITTVQLGFPAIFRRGICTFGLLPVYGHVGGDIEALKTWQRRLFYAAGPLLSLAFGLALLGTGNCHFLHLTGMVSLSLGLFNLLPIPPLDGYRIMACFLPVGRTVQVSLAVVGWGGIALWHFLGHL